MTEKQIAKKLFDKWLRSDVSAHNINFFRFESDVLALKKSGYMTEYEIKLTLSDFRADFKKKCRGLSRHEFLEKGFGANRFYYVVPDELIEKIHPMIPEWCGIISLWHHNDDNKLVIHIQKSAKLLHKNTFDDKARMKILTAMYWKAWYQSWKAL